MDKIDIANENLCIKKLISVIKGENSVHHKTLSVSGRHSDAFVYIMSGSCTYRFDDGISFTASAGNVLYLPYRSVYTMYIHTPEYKFIFCDFEFSEQQPKAGALYTYEIPESINSQFSKLLNLYRSASKYTYTECMSVLYSLYSVIKQSADRLTIGKNKKDFIIQAKHYIDENFSDTELTVSALAEKSGVSEVYFRKLFNARYGISPAKHLISVRLQKAKEFMKYPFLTLENCALQSGFSSLQYFCRLFKKETGISPGKYRQTNMR